MDVCVAFGYPFNSHTFSLYCTFYVPTCGIFYSPQLGMRGDNINYIDLNIIVHMSLQYI